VQTPPTSRPDSRARRTRRRSLSAALVGLAALAGVGAAQPGCSSPGEQYNLQGDVRLTLLHTADWHSRLFPYEQQVNQTDLALGLRPENAPFGGAARMNYLIQRERQRADRLLHLDSGDCFQGAPIFNFFNGEAEVRALAHTGVDGVVVGNHEFDRGALNFARQYQQWATFDTLAANYQFDDPTTPGSSELGRFVRPYTFYNLRGLKVGVIGLGNLSSITSIFDQPNRLGIVPLNTVEVTQHYVDLVREQGADVIVVVSHVGLEDDIHTLEMTTGVDIVLGGHLHIVLNPTQEVEDCRPFDAQGNHFIPILEQTRTTPAPPTACAPNECCATSGVCPPSGQTAHWRLARGYRARACRPRRVVLQHSGAFMKYLGRLDTVLSRDPARIYPGRERDYDPRDRWEVVSSRFSLFPVDSTVPEEPTMKRMLEPYARALDTVANLDNLVGYAPADITRTPAGGGDSALGNLVATSMWLRLGIQTDFSLTNTLGIRDNIPAGPVTVDQLYNVFPFDNSITTMILSGREVQRALRLRRAALGRARVPVAGAGGGRTRRPRVRPVRPAPTPRAPSSRSRRARRPSTSGCATDPRRAARFAAKTPTPSATPAGMAATPPAERRSLCEPGLASLHDPARRSTRATRRRSTTTSRAAARASSCSSATPRRWTRAWSSATP
jgi:5'-nucleotidase/UDP-sugar diphosphatase